MLCDAFELVGRDEAAHVVAPVERHADLHRCDAFEEASQELVGDLLVHDETLDRDAQLARAREDGALRALGGARQVGVIGDVHGVLATEFERRALEPLPRVARDDAARLRRTGEHHRVRVLEHRPADVRPVAEDDLEQPLGQARLVAQFDGAQAREARLLVRAQDDGVARRERRQRVRDRHRQRVVPRRDDADDALRQIVRARLRQHRKRAEGLALGEIARRLLGVVTAHARGVEHLLERLDARLARLDLDEVEQLVLAIEHEVVQPREELDAFADVALCPFLLRCARPFVGGDDVVGRRRGQRADRLPRQRRHAFLRRAARDDAGAHASDGRLVESKRTLRARLGVQ